MRMRFRLPLLLLPLSFVCAAPGSTQSASAVYAIQGAKIYTLVGPAIENGTVIIRDGKIAAVGANVSVPSDAQLIDAKGLAVYPGLFDPITQVGLSEIGAVS